MIEGKRKKKGMTETSPGEDEKVESGVEKTGEMKDAAAMRKGKRVRTGQSGVNSNSRKTDLEIARLDHAINTGTMKRTSSKKRRWKRRKRGSFQFNSPNSNLPTPIFPIFRFKFRVCSI